MDGPNIVLVTVDSLRADHCGFLNNECGLTPALDSLANEGVVFENAVSPGPRTPSSMPTIFTGQFLYSQGYRTEQWQKRRLRIIDHLARFTTIAERMHSRGYTTYGFNTNPWTTADTGFNIGFDRFADIGFDEDIGDVTDFSIIRFIDQFLDATGNEHLFRWDNKKYWFAHWTQFYDRIIDTLREVNEPYFTWIFLTDSHLPYIVPNQFREESSALEMYYSAFRQNRHSGDDDYPPHVVTLLRRAYRDTIRSVDGFFNRLKSDISNEDTRIIVHADHGEAFGEHGTYGHQRSFYEENINVPFLLANTVRTERVSDLVTLRSLPAVIERVADKRRADSFGDLAVEMATSTTENRGSHAVLQGDWKYVDNGQKLYNLAWDPKERTNLATDYPEITETFQRFTASCRRQRQEQLSIARATMQLTEDDNSNR